MWSVVPHKGLGQPQKVPKVGELMLCLISLVHLFSNYFDRPKATKGEHDSQDNPDGLWRQKEMQR